MNVTNENLKYLKKLLAELDTLESALDVSGNYDAELKASFSSYHNNNTHEFKRVFVPIPPEIQRSIKSYVIRRKAEVLEELEKM